jgi:hypothetical protein
MSPDARWMFGIIGDVRESGIALAHLVPVRRWNLVARITCHLVLSDVMRELRIATRGFGSG